MLGLPEVVKGILCFQLAPRNDERLDKAPYFGALALRMSLRESKPIAAMLLLAGGIAHRGERLQGSPARCIPRRAASRKR
jgi:hypothetical protein